MTKHCEFSVKTRRAALALACVLALGACAGGGRESGAGGELPPVVATVNGHEIPTKLYEMYVKNGREALGLSDATEEGRRKLELLREGVVSELIDRALIAQEAERRGLRIEPEKLAEAERQAITQLGGEQKFGEYLKENRLTREEYREVVKSQVAAEMLRAALRGDVKVSDEEVRAFYEAHRDDADFQKPERVRASHILVSARPNIIAEELGTGKGLKGEALEAAVREEMARRRARAEELRRRAAAPGADFAALARENSDDPGTRAQGGDLGFFKRDTHTRAFDEAAFALKQGEVSRVIETEYGFHIIKLVEREPSGALALEEAAPEIRRRLLAQREAQRLNDWLRDARRQANIRINEPFRFGKLKEGFKAERQG